MSSSTCKIIILVVTFFVFPIKERNLFDLFDEVRFIFASCSGTSCIGRGPYRAKC